MVVVVGNNKNGFGFNVSVGYAEFGFDKSKK